MMVSLLSHCELQQLLSFKMTNWSVSNVTQLCITNSQCVRNIFNDTWQFSSTVQIIHTWQLPINWILMHGHVLSLEYLYAFYSYLGARTVNVVRLIWTIKLTYIILKFKSCDFQTKLKFAYRLLWFFSSLQMPFADIQCRANFFVINFN